MKIGIFDSGLGGLMVLKELIKAYPYNTYYYYGDTKNIPYGEKDKKTLLQLATKIINFFIEKKVDIIIIACGTISSNCYNELKKMTKIKIYDILTPTIEYLKTSRLSKIAVFGTKRTIASHVFKKDFSSALEIATPEFVTMIENNQIDEKIIRSYLTKLTDQEALVLACTHYPLLIPIFKKYLSSNIKIIDMGVVLKDKLSLPKKNELEVKLYFTKIDKVISNNIASILDTNYSLELIES